MAADSTLPTMGDSKLSRTVTINNPQGLHARPAQLFAELAARFNARIEVIKDNQPADAKSILSILTLGATQGTSLRIDATGKDAEEALDALARLVANGFAEDTSTDQEMAG